MRVLAMMLVLATTTNHVLAQAKDDDENCFLKWQKLFNERGAYDVADSVYSDVIITFRNGSDATCFRGKVEVKGGKVISMFIRMEDGQYEQVKKKLKYDIKESPIQNGISTSLLTSDDQLINVLFIKKIKPKKKGYDVAPDPSGF